MNILLYNCRIAPMISNEIVSGEIHISNGTICYMGEEKSSSLNWDQEIDCENNLILPGFKNAHTHTAMTFLRSYADDLPLNEWLFDRVFPMEAKLTFDDQVRLAKLGILEYLTSGITANFDMYLDNEAHAVASKEMGFRTVLCGSMNDFGGTAKSTEEEYYRLNEFDPLVSYKIGFHAETTTKKESIEELSELVNRLKEPIYLHIAETKVDVDQCYERYNMSPFEFLDSVGLFNYGGGGFHGVWMSDKDREICQKRGFGIVSNPSSNLKLASGIADLCAMIKSGIKVGLGTDGPASNNALDMFREMYLASVLPKVTNQDAAAMDSLEVLRMATVNGAQIMGLKDCDSLAVGKKADLILIDMKRPNMQPENNILKNIVYAGSKDNVKMTMVDGKILYQNGIFCSDYDVEKIYADAANILERIR